MEKNRFDELKRKFKTNELYNLYLETGEDFDKVSRSMSRAGKIEMEEAKEFLQAVIDEHELDSIKSVMIEEDPQVNIKKNKKRKNKKKLNKLLLISFILGALYAVYSISYWSGSMSSSDSAEALGGAIALTLVMPHLICSILGAVFNGIALFLNKRWSALVGAICYTVAMAAFPIYFFFVIVQAILSYIAFAKMKNQ